MKKIIYGKEARKGLKEGLDIVANAVKVTAGAKGLPVAIDQPYSIPLVTKDGVTVANSIILEDPHLNMGANMIISAAIKTNEAVGDGTSSSCILTQAIVEEGIKVLEEGKSFYQLKKEMENATEDVISYLEKSAISIKDDFPRMKAIPTISANNDDEIGTLIAETFQEVGEHGFISVEESRTSKTYVETSKGLKMKMAPESQYFFQDTIKKTAEYKKSKILLYIGRIEREEEILPILEKTQGDHLLIVCNEIAPLLLQRLISTRMADKIKVTVMQSPEFGQFREEAMEDIALVCGSKLFLQEKDDDISKATVEDLGEIEKLILTEDYTSFINSKTNNLIEEKVTSLLELQNITEDVSDLKLLKERVARLKGGVARIYVGATSEMEMKEKRDRIVDAVNALTVAYKDGVVLGGGTALLNAAKRMKIKNEGQTVIQNSIQYPFQQILLNAGYSKEQIEELKTKVKGKKGFDVIKDKIVDLDKSGILDPVGVTISALRNALSVAIVFLSTEAVLVDCTNYATKPVPVFADGI